MNDYLGAVLTLAFMMFIYLLTQPVDFILFVVLFVLPVCMSLWIALDDDSSDVYSDTSLKQDDSEKE